MLLGFSSGNAVYPSFTPLSSRGPGPLQGWGGELEPGRFHACSLLPCILRPATLLETGSYCPKAVKAPSSPWWIIFTERQEFASIYLKHKHQRSSVTCTPWGRWEGVVWTFSRYRPYHWWLGFLCVLHPDLPLPRHQLFGNRVSPTELGKPVSSTQWALLRGCLGFCSARLELSSWPP